MAKRFGRNQKRRMREHTTRLEESLQQAESQVFRLQREIAQAEDAALSRFMSQGRFYEQAVTEMAGRVGEVLGGELRPYAEQIMRAQQRDRGSLFRLNAKVDEFEPIYTTLSVVVPSINLNFKMCQF